MNIEYINHFIDSFEKLFTQKLKSEITQGELAVSTGEINVREFAAVVDYTGSIEGAVALFFPVKTALNIVSAIERKQVVVIDEGVTDHLGAIVSSVAREARAKFPDKSEIEQTEFTIMRGNDIADKYQDTVWLEVPFDTDFGEVTLRTSLKKTDHAGEEQGS